MDSLLCFKVELRDLCPFMGLKRGRNGFPALLWGGIEGFVSILGVEWGTKGFFGPFEGETECKVHLCFIWVGNGGKMGSLVLILGVKQGNLG